MELDNNRLDSFHDDIIKVVEKYPEFYIEIGLKNVLN